jgi:hypothetical protein
MRRRRAGLHTGGCSAASKMRGTMDPCGSRSCSAWDSCRAPLVIFVETTIVASGAAIGMQVIAVIVFVVAMFAVFEITLVSYLAARRKPLRYCDRCTTGRWLTVGRS